MFAMARKLGKTAPRACLVPRRTAPARRTGSDGLALGMLLGAAGVFAGKALFSAPRDTGERMSQLVKQYRNHLAIRTFVGKLLRGTDPRKPVPRIERIFRVIADHVQFLGDPGGEYVAAPTEVLETGVGDCDCKATALAALLEAAGYRTRFVLIPEHAFVEVAIARAEEIELPDKAFRRHDGDTVWVALESTAASAPIGWADVQTWKKAIQAGKERVIDNRT